MRKIVISKTAHYKLLLELLDKDLFLVSYTNGGRGWVPDDSILLDAYEARKLSRLLARYAEEDV